MSKKYNGTSITTRAAKSNRFNKPPRSLTTQLVR